MGGGDTGWRYSCFWALFRQVTVSVRPGAKRLSYKWHSVVKCVVNHLFEGSEKGRCCLWWWLCVCVCVVTYAGGKYLQEALEGGMACLSCYGERPVNLLLLLVVCGGICSSCVSVVHSAHAPPSFFLWLHRYNLSDHLLWPSTHCCNSYSHPGPFLRGKKPGLQPVIRCLPFSGCFCQIGQCVTRWSYWRCNACSFSNVNDEARRSTLLWRYRVLPVMSLIVTILVENVSFVSDFTPQRSCFLTYWSIFCSCVIRMMEMTLLPSTLNIQTH